MEMPSVPQPTAQLVGAATGARRQPVEPQPGRLGHQLDQRLGVRPAPGHLACLVAAMLLDDVGPPTHGQHQLGAHRCDREVLLVHSVPLREDCCW